MFIKNVKWVGMLLAFTGMAGLATPAFARAEFGISHGLTGKITTVKYTPCGERNFTSILADISVNNDENVILLESREENVIDIMDANFANDFINESVKEFALQFIQSPDKDKIEKLILLVGDANNCPRRLDGSTLLPSEREEYAVFFTFVLSLNKKWISDSGLLIKSFREAQHSPLAKVALARIYLFGLLDAEKNINTFGNFIAQGSTTTLSDKTILWAFKNDIQWSAKYLWEHSISRYCKMVNDFNGVLSEHKAELCDVVSQKK